MKQIVLTKGLPASGKSTWAVEYVKDNKGWVRVNNDELSTMLFGEAFVKGVSNNISTVRLDLVKKLMDMGKNIIIDNTNLCPDREIEIRGIVQQHNHSTKGHDAYEVIIKDFTNVSVSECIRRNRLRANPVPDKAIYEMYHSYLAPSITLATQNNKLPKAVIVDIDGTIARNVSRNIYDHTRYYEDEPIHEVLAVIRGLEKAGNKIIFLTGRDNVGREVTVSWLKEKAGFSDYTSVPALDLETTDKAFTLLMRPDSGSLNKAPDFEFKEAMFNQYIKDKFYVSAWFEDRIRNIEMARNKLGLTPVFQVGEGNF